MDESVLPNSLPQTASFSSPDYQIYISASLGNYAAFKDCSSKIDENKAFFEAMFLRILGFFKS
jgi:hypothetical protein